MVPTDATYPDHDRYTLQQLYPPNIFVPEYPNNLDAAFLNNTRVPKPSDLLLHYNYGAAVVSRWGHGAMILDKDRVRPIYPPGGVSEHARGPESKLPNRSAVLTKLGAAWDAGSSTGSGSGPRSSTRTVVVDSDGKDLWDEDETMLFFWGNSKATLERHRRREVENNQNMEQWRQTVHQN